MDELEDTQQPLTEATFNGLIDEYWDENGELPTECLGDYNELRVVGDFLKTFIKDCNYYYETGFGRIDFRLVPGKEIEMCGRKEGAKGVLE